MRKGPFDEWPTPDLMLGGACALALVALLAALAKLAWDAISPAPIPYLVPFLCVLAIHLAIGAGDMIRDRREEDGH